ncbi:heterogeneous nuclear ribonucleoproteins A1 homolog [Pollicipes pollicipes]|uniref:heterogeneous nuclear ribonucleoproteins A1 homolog n=1 Tax=Pollicipes pollicipes TaxID=41117 RepID=UPI001884B0A6|nr:heterogeneous nuclear ribonucleoproteins A1 homolog [Pollicipes pollicipes]
MAHRSTGGRGAGDGGYGKQPDGYFQYVNVPGHKEYEFGWNRGNPHHYISRYEQAKDHRFRTRVKWADTKGGSGEHYWEYNHAPKGYGKGQGKGHGKGQDKGYGKSDDGGYGKGDDKGWRRAQRCGSRRRAQRCGS